MAKARKDPFDVELDERQEHRLANDLANELDYALQAIQEKLRQNEDSWQKYEAGRAAHGRDWPWPGAADLTSYIAVEKTDALHARIMRTIFTEPIWTVEGWGSNAERAPIVEEFHQWKAEDERLQGFVDRAALSSLVETMGILEVSEKADLRKERRMRRLKIQTHADQTWMLGDDNKPLLAQNEAGEYIDAEGEEPFAETVVDQVIRVNGGPEYQVLLEKDFLLLPAHARERKDIWGFAKRFWRRVPELHELQARGIYKNVDDLGESGDRQPDEADDRAHQSIALQEGASAEKELWELLIRRDLDGDGLEEWYLVTISAEKRTLLRLKYDDPEIGQRRYILFIPFPRVDRVGGYSFIGDKLYTLIEEHTGQRNMIADRSVLAINAPMKRVIGSAWDPYDQPWGPGAIIDVRDPNELTPVTVPDVPASAIERERTTLQAAERVSGLNDIALGVQSQGDRTLGENQMVFAQSTVRMDLVVHRIQEAMEDLGQIRNTIWERALKHKPAEAAQRVIDNLTNRGVADKIQNKQITADLLRGPWRFKPRGSVDTADIMGNRQDFNGLMQSLVGLAKVNPSIAMLLQQPRAAKALLEWCLRVYRAPDRQAFLGTPLQEPQPPQPAGAPAPAPGQPAQPDIIGQLAGLLPPAGPQPPTGGMHG